VSLPPDVERFEARMDPGPAAKPLEGRCMQRPAWQADTLFSAVVERCLSHCNEQSYLVFLRAHTFFGTTR